MSLIIVSLFCDVYAYIRHYSNTPNDVPDQSVISFYSDTICPDSDNCASYLNGVVCRRFTAGSWSRSAPELCEQSAVKVRGDKAKINPT